VPVPAPAYPSQGTFSKQDFLRLERNLGKRLDHLARSLMASLEPAWWEGVALRMAWRWWARNRVKRGVLQAVAGVLKAYRL
jgi:predicted transcriptional regulator